MNLRAVNGRVSSRQVRVAFVDLRPQNDPIAREAALAIDAVRASGAFVLGPAVRRFEQEYAAFCGVGHCVGVGSGTDAIELALRGAGIGPGDEVVLPANTFVATAEAVIRAGADPVFADCTRDMLIDPQQVRRRMTRRTRAVIGVDLYGQVAPFEELRRVVGADVVLVEDAAQSHGATRHGRVAGSFGDVATTSFYPGKNLGAFGDGGAVTTNSAAIASRVRSLRNHGGESRHEHRLVGTNSRLDAVQAAVLSVKLERLQGWNAERVAAATTYHRLLDGVRGCVRPRVVPGNEHVWHLYVVRVPERDRVRAEMAAEGISTGVHYPVPVPLLPAMARLRPDSDPAVARSPRFRVAEVAADEILSLPMYPGIRPADQHAVVTSLRRQLVGRA